MADEICIHCWQDLAYHHYRNLRCPNRETIYRRKHEAIYWNPYNKVVSDHRDGTIYQVPTDIERKKRGLPVPWSADIAETEVLGRKIQ